MGEDVKEKRMRTKVAAGTRQTQKGIVGASRRVQPSPLRKWRLEGPKTHLCLAMPQGWLVLRCMVAMRRCADAGLSYGGIEKDGKAV